jgi:uncharacterized protein (TIGR02147 family)
MPSMEKSSYRDILKIELADRIALNPAYSLRAMAKQVKLSPSMLSALLTGKKYISAERAFSIAKALKFDKKKNEYFVTLVQLETVKSEELKNSLIEKLLVLAPQDKSRTLDLDVFRVISDWYHLSMLELTHVDDFSLNPATAAQALGISKMEAEVAIERLLRLELLEKDSKGRLGKAENLILATSPIPNQALRKYHEQMLKKASESLETQTPDQKFVGSETFAFDEKHLKKATEIIEECFTKIINLAGSKKNKKQVYHLGIQMFRLTKELL